MHEQSALEVCYDAMEGADDSIRKLARLQPHHGPSTLVV